MAAGYGRDGWSSGKYGQPTSIEVTGVSATGAVGTVVIPVSVKGVSATGAVGTVTITQGTGVTVSATGVSATGSVGTVTVTQGEGITVSATGVLGTGVVGTVTLPNIWGPVPADPQIPEWAEI